MNNWQPIDTAPKGERVILYFPAESGRNRLAGVVTIDFYPVHYPRKPTHWMPIPELPKAVTEA